MKKNKILCLTSLVLILATSSFSNASKVKPGGRNKRVRNKGVKGLKTQTKRHVDRDSPFSIKKETQTPFQDFMELLIGSSNLKQSMKGMKDKFVAGNLRLRGKPLTQWRVVHSEGKFTLESENETIHLAKKVPSEDGPSYQKVEYNVVELVSRDGLKMSLNGKLFLTQEGRSFRAGGEVPLIGSYQRIRETLNEDLVQNGNVLIERERNNRKTELIEHKISEIKDVNTNDNTFSFVLKTESGERRPLGYLKSEDISLKLSSAWGAIEIPLSQIPDSN